MSEIQAMLDVADERMRVVIWKVHVVSTSGVYQIYQLAHVSQYKISVYDGEPESYVTFYSNECRKAIDAYFGMRSRYGEDVSKRPGPVVREQFDRRDPFAVAHPQRIKRITLRKKLTEMAEAAGIRTRTPLEGGQKGAKKEGCR